ncbi:acyl carrier protein [Rhodococcus wratislaviensis]|uniref:acyl carrier protein n=1 Tax=Rhodococcus wratislaviensis TaxID=44752 RepID=UPI0036521EF8
MRAEVARVRGFPAAALKAIHTLVGDLGFNSIMITDLFGGVSRAFPGLVAEPHWFSPSRTLGDVIAHVTSHHAPVSPTAGTVGFVGTGGPTHRGRTRVPHRAGYRRFRRSPHG